MKEYFKILSDEKIRIILNLLKTGEKNVGQLVKESGLKQPVVSMLLILLKTAKLVSVKSISRQRIYRLNPDILDLVIKKIVIDLDKLILKTPGEFIIRR